MSSRIPPLLEPYLGLQPEASLTVLTSVLGASSNWLVLRYLYSLLRSGGGVVKDEEGEGGPGVGVVLVSFLRDGAFWREGAGRMGLDLDTASRSGKFTFIDGLTSLFTPHPEASPLAQPTSETKRPGQDRTLRSSRVGDVRREVEAALEGTRAGGNRAVLIVDQLDALVAAKGEEGVGREVGDMILGLRERAHSTILTFSADTPLLHAQTTSLEREHAALVLSQAHAARRVLALRVLDTGAARDVSGVVRVSIAAGGDDDDGGAGEEEGGREFLYHVAGDGAVRVFERGA